MTALAFDEIRKALLAYLQENPECSEHELINHLKNQACEPFVALDLKHSKALFSAHFLVKHCLYRLQIELLKQQRAVLDISAVRVRLAPYHPGRAMLVEHDTVRDYYLDIRHYFETSEAEVDALLGSFWQRYLSQDETAAALEVLGLPADSSYQQMKQQYRVLAQKSHPDKGGCPKHFARINAAKALLDKALR